LSHGTLFFSEGFEVVVGFGTAEDGGEGGEEDFVEWLADCPLPVADDSGVDKSPKTRDNGIV